MIASLCLFVSLDLKSLCQRERKRFEQQTFIFCHKKPYGFYIIKFIDVRQNICAVMEMYCVTMLNIVNYECHIMNSSWLYVLLGEE